MRRAVLGVLPAFVLLAGCASRLAEDGGSPARAERRLAPAPPESAMADPSPGDQEDPPPVQTGFRLTYHLLGGFAGFDATFTIDGSGRMRYERHRPGRETKEARLAPGEAEALARLVRGSGFLDLGPRHEAKTTVSDAFEYVIRWEEGERSKEVSASDGAPLPEPFRRVREAIDALEQRTREQPSPGEAE